MSIERIRQMLADYSSYSNYEFDLSLRQRGQGNAVDNSFDFTIEDNITENYGTKKEKQPRLSALRQKTIPDKPRRLRYDTTEEELIFNLLKSMQNNRD